MNAVVVVAAALAVAGAIGVVVSKIPVHSVLALVINLVGLATLYISLGAEYMGLVQIIVYAGAVMVLFVFVISLLSATKAPLERPVDLLVGQGTFGGLLVAWTLMGVGWAAMRHTYPEPASVWSGYGGIKAFGAALFYEHVFALQLAALLLLVAVVGVVSLIARRD